MVEVIINKEVPSELKRFAHWTTKNNCVSHECWTNKNKSSHISDTCSCGICSCGIACDSYTPRDKFRKGFLSCQD